MKRLLILFLILSLLPACLMIPLPSDHGSKIDKVQKQIKIGSTTREEVISILGPPEVTRDGYILYKHKEYSGGMAVLIFIPLTPEGGVGGVVGKTFMDLIFEFDSYGVLIDFRTDNYDMRGKTVKDFEEDPETKENCDLGIDSCT